MGWVLMSTVMMLMAFSVAIILYYISKLLKLPKLELWAKGEIAEVMVTAGIVGLLIGLVYLMNMIGCIGYGLTTTSLSSASEVETFCTEHHYSPTNIGVYILYNKVLRLQRRVYAIAWTLTFLCSAVGSVEVSAGIDLSFLNIFSYVTPGTAPLTVMMGNLIYFTLLSIELIKFFDYFAMFALPIGVVLRAFPGTRGMGAMLIGISIGFAFVFPTTISMMYYVLWAEDEPVVMDMVGEASRVSQNVLDPMMDECVGTPSKVFGVIETYRGLIDSGEVSRARDIIDGLYRFVFKLFLIELTALLFAVTVTRSLSMVLGADLAEIGAGLFKFI